MYVCMDGCMDVCMDVCMYVCMYVCICTQSPCTRSSDSRGKKTSVRKKHSLDSVSLERIQETKPVQLQTSKGGRSLKGGTENKACANISCDLQKNSRFPHSPQLPRDSGTN